MKQSQIRVKKRNGTLAPYDVNKINKCAVRACEGLEGVSASELILDSQLNIFDKITTEEIDRTLLLKAREKMYLEPNWGLVASRILASCVYKEVMNESVDSDTFDSDYRAAFIKNIKKGVKAGILSERLLNFDLKRLAAKLVPERDNTIDYVGMQNLADRYFLRDRNKKLLETPQAFYMRVAMGVSIPEFDFGKMDANDVAEKLYEIYSLKLASPSTPTLFNAGTVHNQLISCFLDYVGSDSIDGIFDSLWRNARKSKYAGGLGFHVSNIRGSGAYIAGTNGVSSGLIPWLKIYNDMLLSVNQCFVKETLVITSSGKKPISEVKVGDMVLNKNGKFSTVSSVFKNERHVPLVEFKTKHSIDPVICTEDHKIRTIFHKKNSNMPLSAAKYRKADLTQNWTEAKNLTENHFCALPIYNIVEDVEEISKDDCRFYGLMIGDGSMTHNREEFKLFLNEANTEALPFVREYLKNKSIYFSERSGKGGLVTFSFTGRGRDHIGRDDSSGRFVKNENAEWKLPFVREDLYLNKDKRISRKFLNLPNDKAIGIIVGLLESDGNISRGKEMTYISACRDLIEDIRTLISKFGCPAGGYYKESMSNFEGCRPVFCKSWTIRIPCFDELSKEVNIPVVTKKNWFVHDGMIWSRVRYSKPSERTDEFVYDLEVPEFSSFCTDSFFCHNSGKRAGSGCAYLEPWHIDVEEFLDLRKSNGEERRRCHDLNTALWCCDIFFRRIQEDGQWTLFCPSECRDLPESYGKEFEEKYCNYEKLADEGKIKNFKRIKAKDLWKACLKALFETSHAWITMKDVSNKRYSNKHQGVIHGSNLCVAPETKILTFDGEREIKDLAGLTVEVWNGKEWSSARCEKTGENQKLIKIGVSVQGFFGRGEDVVCGSSIDESVLYVTEYHKFYSDQGIEIRASDLKLGQKLENWINPENGYYTKAVYVSSVDETGRYDDTYCVNEPKRHRAVFNGVLTGNCTEIMLHNKGSDYSDGEKTDIGETAVCCLSSVNIANHSDDKGKIDKDKVANTVKWLVRALDNVIEQNFYPTKETEKSAKLHRALGMGVMANFDLYAKKGIPCDSDKAVEIADQLFELISYNAINASADLARERGNYPTFEGSEWSKGIVPIDNYEGDIGGKGKLDWDSLREKVKGGIRNSNLMAVAPNASIAYQHGCEQSHEPIFSVIFRYENKSGNYYIVNRHFIDDMKREGIWSPAFAEAVKAVDGDVTQLDIPQKYKDLYKKCFDRDMFKLIDACAARQKWVDQGLSFNLYNGGTSLKYLNDIYMHCWKRGLKSTYYLRNKPASKVAAVTTIEDPKKKELEEFNKMMDEAKKKAESGESCEMCQG